MRFQGRSPVLDLEYEDVVRIRLRDRDVEGVAARFLLHRRRGVLFERRQIVVDSAGHDIDIDSIDVERRGLRRRLVASNRQQRRRGDDKRDGGGRFDRLRHGISSFDFVVGSNGRLADDVIGFSRMASADEDRTLARLRTLRSELIDPAVAGQNGRVFKRTGDGALVEFRSVVEAVRCAITVQNAMIERNVGMPVDQRIDFRIGIHLGDVVEENRV